MDRRKFIKGFTSVAALMLGGKYSKFAQMDTVLAAPYIDSSISDSLYYQGDIGQKPLKVAREQIGVLHQVVARLKRLRLHIGYGNFNLLGFDQALKYARLYPRIGAFTSEEKVFLDDLFHTKATKYGFMGKKVLTKITDQIPKKEVMMLPGTGHFLFKEAALSTYHRIKKEIGATLYLTSGVRSIVKQMDLFLQKVIAEGGNLSEASRSLAPPGYSYHGIGDFDVGKIGLGSMNFTARFAKTKEYQRLIELGYIEIRYPINNRVGVRFEPWHIKIKV